MQKGQQPASKRAGTPAPTGKTGGVTRSAAEGMALAGSANNNIGNGTMNKGGTRPITTGTPAPKGSFGNVTKNRN